MEFNQIQKRITKAVTEFQRTIPLSQSLALQEILLKLRGLELDPSGKIKSTIKNLRVVESLKNKLVGIIVSDEYMADLKKYVEVFRDVTNLQNEYWKGIEATYKPRVILKEIRKQAITDTVNKLTEAGIGTNIADKLTDILRSNITSGGSYYELEQQLRDSLMNNRTGDGILERYTRQITTDAVNQYSAQYTQTVSQDLGAEWFQFQGTEIKTSRPICQAMHDENLYFHVSQIPKLLKAQWADGTKMTYTDVVTNELKEVGINQKTKLPNGMIEGTNAENYFIRRNGYNCGHQFRPVLREKSVPLKYRELVYATPEYQAWKRNNA